METYAAELHVDGVNGIGQVNQLVDESGADRRQTDDHADTHDRDQQDVLNEDRTALTARYTLTLPSVSDSPQHYDNLYCVERSLVAPLR